ncbi:acid protease [Corynespora cassiicola Philippines]|uniref:Acid protease n=1 Tax=Corynespora cassiicola Philippines TaxID=1448308 RepID=A0A2T2NWL2_CORCC|nr:acid protease [Corynespora cassiicola Philippines]
MMSSILDTPRPFHFSPSQAWDGNDGSWSTFIIRIGTPSQSFRILPSTSGQETFVPVTEGCTLEDPQNCGELRGVYPFRGLTTGFRSNQSSTWSLIGLYDLAFQDHLNISGNGMYGFDTVGLTVDGDMILNRQIVAGIATKDFYLGIFGLGPKPSNFSDFGNPQPSFMQSMRDQNKIPSMAFAYSAGAPYRIPKTLGSLTLGGYDRSKFTPTSNELSFPFSSDDSRSLSVGVQAITAMNTLNGTITLSSSNSPIFIHIDSTVPHLWLPRTVCDGFEQVFGLTYDPQTDLYIFNDSAKHEQLLAQNPSLVIALGNTNDPEKLVQITLPFAALDLQASHPIYSNLTPYFPLRRAANDTQYTLGRAFFQEAYVIADYERSNFSVHQVVFRTDTSQDPDLVAIYPPNSNLEKPLNETFAGSGDSDSDLSPGSISGIVVGVVVAFAVLLALFYIRFRKKSREEKNPIADGVVHDAKIAYKGQETNGNPLYEMAHQGEEMGGTPLCEMAHSTDSASQFYPTEIGSSTAHSTPEDRQQYELPGSEAFLGRPRGEGS